MSRAVCALTPGNSTISRSLPDRTTVDSDTPNGLMRFSTIVLRRPSRIDLLVVDVQA
jgi:hypothetical protein